MNAIWMLVYYAVDCMHVNMKPTDVYSDCLNVIYSEYGPGFWLKKHVKLNKECIRIKLWKNQCSGILFFVCPSSFTKKAGWWNMSSFNEKADYKYIYRL